MGRFGLLSKGIRKVKTLVYTFSAFSLAGFALGTTACSTSSDEGPTAFYNIEPSSYTKEFLFNYQLLYYLYIDKDKYLSSPETYINKVNAEWLVNEGYPWDYHDIYYMYALMEDPFTNYMDPSRSVALMSSWMTSDPKMDAGFTVDTSSIPEKYVINNVARNSPADHAGLKVGDEITEIEGTALTSEILFNRLSVANEGDVITYTIKRNSTTEKIPVKIESYLSPTVEMTFKDSIPVIKINKFVMSTSNDSGTYGEFVEYLRNTEKYKATIIDLRNNGGGELNQCVAMTQTMLSKGDTTIGIVNAYGDTLHKKQKFDTTFYYNKADGFAKDRYYVILANEKTASCSEIMIAGLTANRKTPVVGANTYGKGIGQTRAFTPSLSLYSITSMRVIDKQSFSYHKFGIEPDFAISNEDSALEKAVALAKDQSFVRVAGYGTVNTGNFAKMGTEPDTMPGFFHIFKDFDLTNPKIELEF